MVGLLQLAAANGVSGTGKFIDGAQFADQQFPGLAPCAGWSTISNMLSVPAAVLLGRVLGVG